VKKKTWELGSGSGCERIVRYFERENKGGGSVGVINWRFT